MLVGVAVGGLGACGQPVGRRSRFDPCTPGLFGLGVSPLLLARWVRSEPDRWGWLVVAHPSVALDAHVCPVSWATWLLFTGEHARCVVLRVRCPGRLGSCSLVCWLSVLCCVCGVLGDLAPVQWRVRSVFRVVCAVSRATWLLSTCVPARWVVSLVRCPGPLGSCAPLRWLGVLCCWCGVLGHLASVHRCAR